jgi:hypothetical protein
MAISAGDWFLISFKSYANVAWTGITPPAAVPSMPGLVHASVLAGTTLLYYCLAEDGTDATLLMEGGQVVQLPIATIASEAVQTRLVETLSDTSKLIFVRGGDGSLKWYDERLGAIRSIGLPGALAAFAT